MASIDDYTVPVNRILDFPSKSDPNPEDLFAKTKNDQLQMAHSPRVFGSRGSFDMF